MRIQCAFTITPTCGECAQCAYPYRGRAHSTCAFGDHRSGVVMGAIDDLLGRAQGEPIPGGCEQCDAEQTLELVTPNVWTVVVRHDDWCPFIRSRQAAMN